MTVMISPSLPLASLPSLSLSSPALLFVLLPTLRLLLALYLPLELSCARPPILQGLGCTGPNAAYTHANTHSLAVADPPCLTSAVVNTPSVPETQLWVFGFLLRAAGAHQRTKLLPAECHFMTGGMVAPTALSTARTHKITHTHARVHTLPPSPSVINQLLCCIQRG